MRTPPPPPTRSFVKFGCSIAIFLSSAHLICRSTDISKYFRGSLRLHDNESRLYIVMRPKYVHLCHSGGILLQKWPRSKFCFPDAHVQCISELCCKFRIPASNTVEGLTDTCTVLHEQCDIVKICISCKGTYFCNNDLNQNSFFLSAHTHCMPELGCIFQIPASNSVGRDAEIRTILQRVTDGRPFGEP